MSGIPATVLSQAPNISYQTPQTYTTNITITPLVPTNTGGAVPATIYGQVTTFAGSGSSGFANGQGISATFKTLYNLCTDNNANIYVADYGNNAIRKITSTGNVSTFAGNSGGGSVNGIGTAASFSGPGGVIADAVGNIYVGDQINNLIRMITSAGVVTTFAGTGVAGVSNGNAASATFNGPAGLAFDNSGNLFVADRNNNLIRKITPAGIVSTFAGSGVAGFTNGTGTAASFNNCTDVATDQAGNVYVTDQYNNCIRKITPSGVVTTFAGNGAVGIANGAAATSNFYKPFALTLDAAGTIYVADEFNQLIRKINSAGVVSTLAGSGAQGAMDGIGSAASFSYPAGTALDGIGNLFVTDATGYKVRKICLTGYTIDKALPAGLAFDPTTGIITGTPTAASPATNYTITAYNSGGSSVTTVNLEVILAPVPKPSIITFPTTNPVIDQNANFNPNATSTNNETPITYTSSDTNIATINPDGSVHVLQPGTLIITANQVGDTNFTPASPTPRTYLIMESQIITFAAIPNKITCDADFSSDALSSNNLIPLTYSSSNAAVATISTTGIIHILGIGTTTITAAQPGNNLYYAAQSQSQVLTVTLPAVPVVSIAANAASTCVGDAITFTATVTNVTANANLVYQWQVDGVNTGSNSSVYTSATLSSTSVIRCIVTNNTACLVTGKSQTITGLFISPYITPAITISSSAVGPVCPGTDITFTSTITNGGTSPTYQWQVNGVNAGSNSATFSSINLTNGANVTCLLTNSGGKCLTTLSTLSNSIAANIIQPANPGPSLSISASANNTYPGVPITFTVVPANSGVILNYQWQVNGTNAGGNNKQFTSSTLSNNDAVTCVISLSGGCIPTVTSNILTITIIPSPGVTINNTFTPNGDGVNDFWTIPDLSFYPNCLVSIFTRSGSEIYSSKGYSKPWDGTYNGRQLPTAPYYYVIDLGNNIPKLSGYITIIR